MGGPAYDIKTYNLQRDKKQLTYRRNPGQYLAVGVRTFLYGAILGMGIQLGLGIDAESDRAGVIALGSLGAASAFVAFNLTRQAKERYSELEKSNEFQRDTFERG